MDLSESSRIIPGLRPGTKRDVDARRICDDGGSQEFGVGPGAAVCLCQFMG